LQWVAQWISEEGTDTEIPNLLRRQALYQPGGRAKIGQILIIESLPEVEMKTGRRLWQDLDDHCTAHPANIKIGFCQAPSSADFLGYLDDLLIDIEKSRLNAFAHRVSWKRTWARAR
jgi:hypothetical protein